ncbi:hypothetical protein Tco_1170537, partial [Tanacetum coccineum]
VVQYNLISKTLHEIYDYGSNQLDDNHDDDDELLRLTTLGLLGQNGLGCGHKLCFILTLKGHSDHILVEAPYAKCKNGNGYSLKDKNQAKQTKPSTGTEKA